MFDLPNELEDIIISYMDMETKILLKIKPTKINNDVYLKLNDLKYKIPESEPYYIGSVELSHISNDGIYWLKKNKYFSITPREIEILDYIAINIFVFLMGCSTILLLNYYFNYDIYLISVLVNIYFSDINFLKYLYTFKLLISYDVLDLLSYNIFKLFFKLYFISIYFKFFYHFINEIKDIFSDNTSDFSKLKTIHYYYIQIKSLF